MDEKITSRDNAKIKYACRLSSSAAFRRSEGRFLAEGRKLCPELCRGAELETLFYTGAAAEKCPELLTLPGEHYLVEVYRSRELLKKLFVNFLAYQSGQYISQRMRLELNRPSCSMPYIHPVP